jgi:dolichol kinase
VETGIQNALKRQILWAPALALAFVPQGTTSRQAGGDGSMQSMLFDEIGRLACFRHLCQTWRVVRTQYSELKSGKPTMLTGVEIKRKIVHLSTLIVPIGYGLTSERTVLTFLIPFFLCFLSIDLLRCFHPGMASLFQKYFFGKVLREEEKTRLMGSTYFLFSSILTILLFPKAIAIASLLILILSDTAAAFVGKGTGRISIFGKTLEGSITFFASALAIVWIYPDLDRFSGFLAALGATVVELFPTHVDDNLTIPFVAGAILFFCGR